MICFSWCFHERHFPAFSLGFAFHFWYISKFVALITFVTYQHNGYIFNIGTLRIICWLYICPYNMYTADIVINSCILYNINTFNSLIRFHIGFNSSRLCLEHTEYTNIKAWPFVIDNLCIAGNWCDPVVSVIWRVHIFLLQLIT